MSEVATPPAVMPATKKKCLALLREHGHRGLRIDEILPDRIYALTGPRLDADGQLRRKAVTIRFWFGEGTPVTEELEGWIVE